jgi:hypothetical protein
VIVDLTTIRARLGDQATAALVTATTVEPRLFHENEPVAASHPPAPAARSQEDATVRRKRPPCDFGSTQTTPGRA